MIASVCVLALCGPAAALAPSAPAITEPGTDGQVVNPADVHMEATGFSDADGNTHQCSDWEIRTSSPSELVWQAPCAVGLLKVHIHLGDGTFVNSYAGRTTLKFDTDYVVRVRFRDSAGESSAWSQRLFHTSEEGPPGQPGAIPWAVRQPGYEVEPVATGFQLPVNIAMVPNPGSDPKDPFFYVTELYGTIKVVSRDGTVGDYASGLLNFNPTGNFPGSGEQGLTGLLVDPQSGDVFASLLYEDTSSTDTPKPHYPKVVRFHSTDGGRTAASQTTILDMPGEPQGQSHQVSNLSIGPDGKLYVHNGDAFDPPTAQNLDSFRGKILRMNKDGSAATDNPFYSTSGGITARDYVFAYGFRNPFGGAWRAQDGSHYEVEDGPTIDRFAQIVGGRNYLWDGSDASMRNYALYHWYPAHAPVNIAFTQPESFLGSGFPTPKMGHAYVTESGPTYGTGPQTLGKRISELAPGADGTFAGSTPAPLIEYTGIGQATAAGLAPGPDGLYFTDLYKDVGASAPTDRGANVFRVKWTGDLTPPALTLTTPANGSATNDETPTLSGKAGDAVGDSDTVSVDIWSGSSASGAPLHTVTAARSGDNWSVVAPQLGEGTYTVEASQNDSRGNYATTSARTFDVDTTAPDTFLEDGPSGAVSSRTAAFQFTSNEQGSFQCKLDSASYGACSSPASYDGLAVGAHSFQVRAMDAAGNLDDSPASRAWSVLAPPPEPVLAPGAVLLPAEESLGQALRGLPVEIACRSGCAAKLVGYFSSKRAGTAARARFVARAVGRRRGAGALRMRLRFTRPARRTLRRVGKVALRLRITVRERGSARLSLVRRLTLRRLRLEDRLRRGLRELVACSSACQGRARLTLSSRRARRLSIRGSGSQVLVGRGAVRLPGRGLLAVRFSRTARARLRRASGVRLLLRVYVSDGSGPGRTLRRFVVLGR